jgi:recombination protein RecA
MRRKTMNPELKKALRAIESLGKDLICKPKDITFISSGFECLDEVLGGKGFPRGRIVEIYGNESGGKTTVSLYTIIEAQKAGLTCAYIDAEHSFDRMYAELLGVNTEDLILISPDYGEQAIDAVRILCDSKEVGLIVVDSTANLVPQAELEKSMDKDSMGLQARLMAKAMRKITATAEKSDTCVIFINQLREKIGIMFGNPETTPGGRALKFYSSIRLAVRSGERIKVGQDDVGYKCNIKCTKSKIGIAQKTCELRYMHGLGFDKRYDKLLAGLKSGDITNEGSWYFIGDKKYHGVDKVLEALT